jgi:hypothetical protein
MFVLFMALPICVTVCVYSKSFNAGESMKKWIKPNKLFTHPFSWSKRQKNKDPFILFVYQPSVLPFSGEASVAIKKGNV